MPMGMATSWKAPELRVKRLGLVAIALCVAPPALAQQAPQDSSQVHVVRPGDTLWDLARQYLSDPFLWPDIFQLNREQVENPHRIFPREQLRIPGLAARRGSAPAPVAESTPAAPMRPTVFSDGGSRMRGQRVLLTGAENQPVVTPGDFYTAGLLATEGEMRPVGQLAELVSPTMIRMNIPPQIQLYDKVYLTLGARGAVRPGEMLQLFRDDRRVQPFGQLYVPTAIAAVLEVHGQVAIVEMRELFDAVEVGNLAVPMPEFRPVRGVEPRQVLGRMGRIVAFQVPQAVHSIEDVAFIDLGRRSGLVEGDELVAVRLPTGAGPTYRPELVVARLQVVRVGSTTAAARVVELEHPALEAGLAVRLVSKMP